MPHFPSKPREPSAASAGPMASPTGEGAAEEGAGGRAEQIRIKNRRKRYLDLHPQYFLEPHLELADPLLYDTLVRRFQSAAERERAGRERGYAGTLEANLVRSEAKLEALSHPDPNSPVIYTRASDGSITGVEQDEEERATDAQEGWAKWKEVMGLRFLRGDDADFEYDGVDGSEEYDDGTEEERERLEEYLDGQEAEFVGEGVPRGQTGVQDF